MRCNDIAHRVGNSFDAIAQITHLHPTFVFVRGLMSLKSNMRRATVLRVSYLALTGIPQLPDALELNSADFLLRRLHAIRDCSKYLITSRGIS